jgi:aspartyl-tRNA(Asn)/glutamyl-tRNA(Gln) amidotransferase subunit B
MQQYETVIGLEIHLQLNTRSKVFCGDDATFGGTPNTHVSAISLAHPGTLPRLNGAAIDSAIRLGLALGCDISLRSTFDRKNYFYADLPKGYQITQDRQPICVGGEGIHHIHLEEDAGKSTHDQDPHDSLIDLNRAGVPLLELVTLPTLRSAEEAAAFMEKIRHLARWLGISDGNMEEGSLRCDVNVSVRPLGSERLGQRCEIKNMNSMRFARQAIKYETERQVALLESGQSVEQQTRGYDPATGTTYPLRDKEDAHDYRYFPDPDLPPVVVTPEHLADIRAAMPPLPAALRARFETEWGLPAYDAHLLTQERDVAFYFLNLVEKSTRYEEVAKAASNLIINTLAPWAATRGGSVSDCPVPPDAWLAAFELVRSGAISASVAKQRLYPAMLDEPTATAADLAQRLGLLQNSDGDALGQLADQVLARYPDKVAEYRKGKRGLIGFFMGELMKAAQGKADPKTATQLLEERLKF